MILFAIVVLMICIVLIPFCFYMGRKDRKEFFAEHGRYSNRDDYLDEGMWP